MRGRRLPLAQGRGRDGRRLAHPGPPRRRRARSTTSASPPASPPRGAASSSRSWRRSASGALDGHPWRDWATARAGRGSVRAADARRPEPLEPRQGPRPGSRCASSGSPRSPTTTSRAIASATPPGSSAGAPTAAPADCRYDQLEATPPYELADIFGERGPVTRGWTMAEPRRRAPDAGWCSLSALVGVFAASLAAGWAVAGPARRRGGRTAGPGGVRRGDPAAAASVAPGADPATPAAPRRPAAVRVPDARRRRRHAVAHGPRPTAVPAPPAASPVVSEGDGGAARPRARSGPEVAPACRACRRP